MVSEMWGLTVSIHGQIKRTNNVCHSVITKHRQMFDRRAFLVRNFSKTLRANFACQAKSSDVATWERNRMFVLPVRYERFLVAKKHRYMSGNWA